MTYSTRVIEVSLRDVDHGKRLKDPQNSSVFHFEAWLPFSEAVKLDRGNANVRPASERKKPFRDMMETVENDPAKFHVKNRGIIYRCEKFEFDNSTRVVRVTNPVLDPEIDELDDIKYGIADGGHTYEVITRTIQDSEEFSKKEGWVEPFVRVHFLAGDALAMGEIEQVVEALNTSSQVQQFTIDEYGNKFEALKEALSKSGFDTNFIAFRENEDKEWEVREVIQRIACFMKDRWKTTQPTQMYRSKGTALELFTSDKTSPEFEKLYDVIGDIVRLPEFIQAEFSHADTKGRKFGALKAVKKLKKPYTRPGTTYTTDHSMDLAASLPIAAAFRELLELKGDRYQWKVDYKEVFKVASDELYKALALKCRTAKSVNALGADTEYWTMAANIVLRSKDEVSSVA
jgi:NTP pyrophosphatase (non-canonical NTP hydrolase)